jgi:hypothetical protein
MNGECDAGEVKVAECIVIVLESKRVFSEMLD